MVGSNRSTFSARPVNECGRRITRLPVVSLIGFQRNPVLEREVGVGDEFCFGVGVFMRNVFLKVRNFSSLDCVQVRSEGVVDLISSRV